MSWIASSIFFLHNLTTDCKGKKFKTDLLLVKSINLQVKSLSNLNFMWKQCYSLVQVIESSLKYCHHEYDGCTMAPKHSLLPHVALQLLCTFGIHLGKQFQFISNHIQWVGLDIELMYTFWIPPEFPCRTDCQVQKAAIVRCLLF